MMKKGQCFVAEGEAERRVLLPAEEIGFVNKVRERLDIHDEYTYRDFLLDWNMFKEGRISKHDLYCKLVDVFYYDPHQTFLDELKNFFSSSLSRPSAA